ncbi:hypothetical protein PPOP_1996 [Paenibacillus popilliae ATCC 14706]|uniref:Uncharacterized protein n=1 Tax=Paenibacillus popilliae ATCC 14706 TaxID=1212764 RepID=M9M5M0_PAEPP|nr:hypothetical protein PPOP_1996 [Paenibacillus popilliae ATCC 14706]
MKKLVVSTMAVMTVFAFSASGAFASTCSYGQYNNVGFNPVNYGSYMNLMNYNPYMHKVSNGYSGQSVTPTYFMAAGRSNCGNNNYMYYGYK